MRTRVKICGITRVEDARVAAECGADAIGLVFYPHSPRRVMPEQAALIAESLPAFVSCVALFVDPTPEAVREVLGAVPVDCLQFHGAESASFCEQFERPYIKALRVGAGSDIAQQLSAFPRARGILLDAYVKDVPGGTGQRFDWSLVPVNCPKPVILAGGLDPNNVAEAIRQTRPYAVDVSGGVEQGKGIKDPVKIRQFIAEVNSVGAS
jgi:phosphoribosylanthranilate isomerase